MYKKIVLVLRQVAEGYSVGSKPACAILRVESENENSDVILSPMGFKSFFNGSYRLYINFDDGKIIEKDLGAVPSSLTFSFLSRIGENFSAGIWFIKDDIPLLIAYQKSDGAKLTRKDYSTAVIEDFIAERKSREKIEKSEFSEKKEENENSANTEDADISKELPAPAPTSFLLNAEKNNIDNLENAKEKTETESGENGAEFFQSDSDIKEQFTAYNDEAVATENYYNADEEINQKLTAIKEYYEEHFGSENVIGDSDGEKKESESGEDLNAFQNEESDKERKGTTYYQTVKKELEAIFNRYPEEKTLKKAFAGSKWAKVFYTEEKYYVVGVVKEKGKEKYICYGVPSSYSETPPKELAGYCSFVPLSVFDLKGDGYFMMFQDAITGKSVVKPD